MFPKKCAITWKVLGDNKKHCISLHCYSHEMHEVERIRTMRVSKSPSQSTHTSTLWQRIAKTFSESAIDAFTKVTDFNSHGIKFHTASLWSHPNPLIQQVGARENSLLPVQIDSVCSCHAHLTSPKPTTLAGAYVLLSAGHMILSKSDLEISNTGLSEYA